MNEEVKNSVTRQGKSFLREAVILTVASFAVKIIGVVFKIPLTNILGESIGIFNAAYSIYAMLFMLSTSGLPVAVSKLVAASNERGRGREAKRIAMLATLVFGVIGLVFAVALFVFAPDIARLTGHADSAVAMRTIAPALFFICVCASVRGYFQGLRNMFPTAISQFIEAFFKLTVGMGAVMYAHSKGMSTAVQAACAISGVSVGTFFAMVYVLLCRRFSKKSRPNETDNESDSDKKLMKLIVLVALPVTLTAAALYFSQFLDTVIVVNCLVDSGESQSVADTLYSAYTGLSVPIYDLLPATLVFPIATSILPAISGARAVNKERRAAKLTEQAIRISGIIAVPCGAFLFVTGRHCISLLYGADKWSGSMSMADGSSLVPLDAATESLAILAFAVFFISIVSTCNSLLNAYSKPHLPFIAVLIGITVLTLSEIALLYSPLGIQGAPLSSVICYCIVMLIDIYFLRKRCGVRLKLAGMFARPVACGIISAAGTYGAYIGAKALWNMLVGTSTDTRAASLFILLISGIALVICYVASSLILRAIKEDEIRLLPMGNKLAKILLRLGWLKPEPVEE
ncbi:MAG: polysaccharide biosynthesis protein [Ruminococcaceae bacterium]|nr:polysaccharide biosynthesis protein [Oscillospiraceae bacterium]